MPVLREPREHQSLLVLLHQAIQAVPSTKYALGLAGIAAAGAIVIGLSRGYLAAALVIVVMLVLMTGLNLFARLVHHNTRGVEHLVVAMAWVFALLICATATMVVTVTFFDWPRPWSGIVGRQGNSGSGTRATVGIETPTASRETMAANVGGSVAPPPGADLRASAAHGAPKPAAAPADPSDLGVSRPIRGRRLSAEPHATLVSDASSTELARARQLADSAERLLEQLQYEDAEAVCSRPLATAHSVATDGRLRAGGGRLDRLGADIREQCHAAAAFRETYRDAPHEGPLVCPAKV